MRTGFSSDILTKIIHLKAGDMEMKCLGNHMCAPERTVPIFPISPFKCWKAYTVTCCRFVQHSCLYKPFGDSHWSGDLWSNPRYWSGLQWSDQALYFVCKIKTLFSLSFCVVLFGKSHGFLSNSLWLVYTYWLLTWGLGWKPFRFSVFASKWMMGVRIRREQFFL